MYLYAHRPRKISARCDPRELHVQIRSAHRAGSLLDAAKKAVLSCRFPVIHRSCAKTHPPSFQSRKSALLHDNFIDPDTTARHELLADLGFKSTRLGLIDMTISLDAESDRAAQLKRVGCGGDTADNGTSTQLTKMRTC